MAAVRDAEPTDCVHKSAANSPCDAEIHDTDSHSQVDVEIRTETSKKDVTNMDRTFTFSESTTLENIRQLQADFIHERNWDKFHAPRNVLLALVGEVGELAEIFQWRGEVEEGLPGWSDADKHHVGQELSDVLLYLVDLADRCQIDLARAALDKMKHNAEKYPADKVYGSSKKYNQYDKTE